MYAEAQQRQSGLMRGAVLGGANCCEPKTATEAAIGHTEIDGELNSLRHNIERLFVAVGELNSRLYPILSGELNVGSGPAAPTPVMNSPLGQSLWTENERLHNAIGQVESIRARVQL